MKLASTIISITVTTVMLAATITAVSCGSKKSTVNDTTQTLTVTAELLQNGVSDTLHFGLMHQGEVIEKSLRIKNGCTTPIVLLRHATSCGCVTLDYDRRPIAPEATTDIKCTFNSRGETGWQMKLIEFYFANSVKPLKIYVEAEVE